MLPPIQILNVLQACSIACLGFGAGPLPLLCSGGYSKMCRMLLLILGGLKHNNVILLHWIFPECRQTYRRSWEVEVDTSHPHK